MAGGRPSDYSPEIAEEICRRLADGESLIRICASDDMPDRETVRRWCRDNEQFCGKYTQARLDAADSFSDLMTHVVETEENPNMINAKVNALALIQARQAPRKYGTQRLGIGQDPDAGPLKIEVVYAESNQADTE